MNHIRKSLFFFCMLLVIGMLTACNAQKQTTKAVEKTEPAQTEAESSKTRIYKDYIGHEVEIPVSPERVIYHGENYGDLLPLDVNPIGASYSWITDFIFEEQVTNVADVGFPINLEKVLELQPELIIIGSTDEQVFEQLSKIAPTIVFDTFAPLEKRLIEFGEILNKKEEATDWLAAYKNKEDAMWKQLVDDGTIELGETTTVLTYYPGNRLFVMAATGLSQVLYHPNGFKPVDTVQPMLDKGVGFEEISLEVLPEYTGDRIFILTPETEEAVQSTKEMLESSVWKGLPAVQNDKVYTLDIVKSSSDASTREWLLEEIPTILKE